ncbi:hypothetical protein EYF80_036727 [Liparis tanakae]|uniref:Uncharacterized protein n=1 Tax=Liparis tanakae TaxID=230148 RepID=A0A4Z2GJQ5_9TELE|nr:hypothetical protein EYF80_036727 [Liparis tanakae]
MSRADVDQTVQLHDAEALTCLETRHTTTAIDHAVAEAGDAHRLQLDPRLSVGVVERTHAARHRGGLPVSVTGHDTINTNKSITMRPDLPPSSGSLWKPPLADLPTGPTLRSTGSCAYQRTTASSTCFSLPTFSFSMASSSQRRLGGNSLNSSVRDTSPKCICRNSVAA